MITGICMVLFAAISGEKVQVNMTAKEFAHLVYEFSKRSPPYSRRNSHTKRMAKPSTISGLV